eukprot:573144-Ditylum_brightwellii.AAC.1
MPSIMIIKMVMLCIIWLNAFAPRSGILSTYSPQTILCGSNLTYKQHCKVTLGAYVQTHEENAPTNSMEDKIIGAIVLVPSFNMQGGYKFLSLSTSQIINRREFFELPVPDNIIKRVEELTPADGEDGNTIFTKGPAPKLPTYKNQMINSYIAEEEEDTHSDKEKDNDIELGLPPPQTEIENAEPQAEMEMGIELTVETNIQHENIGDTELATTPPTHDQTIIVQGDLNRKEGKYTGKINGEEDNGIANEITGVPDEGGKKNTEAPEEENDQIIGVLDKQTN